MKVANSLMMFPRKVSPPPKLSQWDAFRQRFSGKVTNTTPVMSTAWVATDDYVQKTTVAPSTQELGSNSFHCAMRPIIFVAQLFGVLPVAGFYSKSEKTLRFNYLAPCAIYSAISILMVSFVALVSIAHMFRTLKANVLGQTGGVMDSTGGAMFYSNGAIATILFYRLAKHWPELLIRWSLLERNMWQFGTTRLALRFKIIYAFVLSVSLVEHILSVAVNIPSAWMKGNYNQTLMETLQEYNLNSHAFLYTSFNYSAGLGSMIFVVSNIATFTWNFQDLFLIFVSLGLAQRLKLLNKRLQSMNTSQSLRKEDWGIFRRLYADLSSLVKFADEIISPVIMLSFINNLYFICMQLLNGLRPKVFSILHTVYFYGGFLFLVGRALAVTLCAAQINDHSRESLPVLYTCPTELYTHDAGRMLAQINSDHLGLGGLGFFFITRSFLVGVIGAIATYEIVLLQFDTSGNVSCVLNLTQYPQ